MHLVNILLFFAKKLTEKFYAYAVVLFILFDVLVQCYDIKWFFNASFLEIKLWYPNLYLIVYLGISVIKITPLLVIFYQLYQLRKHLTTNLILLFLCFIVLVVVILLLDIPFWWISIYLLIFLLYFRNRTFTNDESIKNHLEKKDIRLIWILVLVAFGLRLLWVFYTDNSGNGDAGMRLEEVKKWTDILKIQEIRNKISISYLLMPSKDWLPLHYYLMGIWSGIIYEWQYSPRILTAIFGALSIIPLYKLSLLKFNRRTAILASVILIFYGYHIFLSSLTLSEVFYTFFVLYTYLIIEQWNKSLDDKQLYRLALVLLCMIWLRYEGWFFAFCIVMLLPSIKKVTNWKIYFIFSGIVFLATAFIMLCEVGYGEHPLRGILYSDFEVRNALNNTRVSFVNLIHEYRNSFLFLTFLGFTLYLFETQSSQKAKGYLLHLLYLLPLLPFVYKLSNGTLTAQARYMTLYMVPLIPFIAFLLNRLTFQFSIWKTTMVIGVYLIVSNFYFFQSVRNGNVLLNYSSGFHNSAKFVKYHINQGVFYVDTEEQWGEFNWSVESNQYLLGSKRMISIKSKTILTKKGNICMLELDKSQKGSYNFSSFNNLYDQNNINYIVLFPNGELTHYLKHKIKNNFYRGKHFKKVFEENGYVVLKVEI